MEKKQKNSYKEPHFLFTKGALRNAAWAGWYAAVGEEKLAESWKLSAMTEYTKEISAGRGHSFLKENSREIISYVPGTKLKKLLDDFLKAVKGEINKGKAFSERQTLF